MARYTGAVCRLCRRENKKLFLKASVATPISAPSPAGPPSPGSTAKRAPERLPNMESSCAPNSRPGVTTASWKASSPSTLIWPPAKPGVTGENLLRICESRLDNVVYRLGFASSRKEARQLVRHGHFTVNGKKANIPSILLKAGDTVAVKSKSDKLKGVVEAFGSRPVPKWLDCDKTNMTGRVIELPNREDIDLDVEEHLIVELYSK